MPVLDKVQLLELKVPIELVVKLTSPTGVTTVPGELSVTVAVQDWCAERLIGTQFTVVLVERWPTVTGETPLLTE